MIAPFDDAIGYTSPDITEREALCELHRLYPDATIEPMPGNPNVLGWHLFKVFDNPNGIPKRVWVTEAGEPIEADGNVPLVEANQ